MAPRISIIDLGSQCILRQLRIEEALHRYGKGNYVVLNRGPATEKSIVLGTSSKISDHVEEDAAYRDNVRLIRRFTGGGTVFVDADTMMVSFIMGGIIHPSPFPRAVMDWSRLFYDDVFQKCSTSTFCLRDNDYCFDDRKFGGNAQTISGDRWVHHTSFLWDFHRPSMSKYLHQPRKQPQYRENRDHHSFLCGMKDHVPGGISSFASALHSTLNKFFDVEEDSYDYMHAVLLPHRKSTIVIERDHTSKAALM